MEPAVRRALDLALSSLSAEERRSAAAYLDTCEADAGARVTIGRAETAMPARGFVAFVDPSPTANWGHPCRYLLIESASGRVHHVDARFPPFLRGTSPTWRLIWKGQHVPAAVLPITREID